MTCGQIHLSSTNPPFLALYSYGAEFSELEKCFHELLQLTKIRPFSVQGDVTSKIEAIDQRWKQCKARSLKFQNMVNQSPARVLQAHFAKIFDNNSNDFTLVDTSVSNELFNLKTFEYNKKLKSSHNFGSLSEFSRTGKSLHTNAITYNRSYDSLVDFGLQKDPNFYQFYKSSIINCSSKLKLSSFSKKAMLKFESEPLSSSQKQADVKDFWIEARQDQYPMLEASTPENGLKSNEDQKLGVCESILIDAKDKLKDEFVHEIESTQNSDYYVTQMNDIEMKSDHFTNLTKNESKNRKFLLKFSIKKWANSKSKLKTALSTSSSKSKGPETQETDDYYESSPNESNHLTKSKTLEHSDSDQNNLVKQPSLGNLQPPTTSEAQGKHFNHLFNLLTFIQLFYLIILIYVISF